MEIYWYGQSCFKIKGKTATVVIDPFDPEFTGLKLPKDLEAQVVLTTHNHQDHNNIKAVGGNPLVAAGPGEYEKSGVSILGLRVFHDNSQGSEKGLNTLYQITVDGITIVHTGDLGHVLTDEQANQIDAADILLIPVGGVYTINAESAAKVVALLEPSIVIPMHYKIPGLKFDLAPLDQFLKEMGVENVAPISKFSITKEKLPEETQVVILNKS